MLKFLRSILAACVLIVAPVQLTACASMGSAASRAVAVTPHTPREALAEAEIAFTGVIGATDFAMSHGFLSEAQVGQLLPLYDQLAQRLDQARQLLAAGETVRAIAELDDLQAQLDALALQLSTLIEQRQAS